VVSRHLDALGRQTDRAGDFGSKGEAVAALGRFLTAEAAASRARA
jgi:hypothetical protein